MGLMRTKFEERSKGRRYEDVRGKYRKIPGALLFRLPDGHGVGGRRGFKADRKKDHLAAGVRAREFKGFCRRINNTHVSALSLHVEEIGMGTGDAKQVAVGNEGHVGT